MRTPSARGRDLVDLRRLEVVPEDRRGGGRRRARPRSPRAAWRSGRPAGRGRSPSGARAGSGSGARSSRRRCGSSIFPASISSPYSRSEKPPPLPIRAPLEVDGDRAAEDEVDLGELVAGRPPGRGAAAPLIVAASRTAAFDRRLGSSSRNGCWSRSRGTAITSFLPSSSARRRAWVCGESGLALITCARFHVRWLGELLRRELGAGEVREFGPRRPETVRPPRGPSPSTRRVSPGPWTACRENIFARGRAAYWSESGQRRAATMRRRWLTRDAHPWRITRCLPRRPARPRRASSCPSAGPPRSCVSCCPRSSRTGG